MSLLKLISSQNNIRAHNTSACSGQAAPLAMSFPKSSDRMAKSPRGATAFPAACRHVNRLQQCTWQTWNKTAHVTPIKNSVYPQVTYFRKWRERATSALYNTGHLGIKTVAKLHEQCFILSVHHEIPGWDPCHPTQLKKKPQLSWFLTQFNTSVNLWRSLPSTITCSKTTAPNFQVTDVS